MQKSSDEGKLRSIGVSNYEVHHLEKMLPMVRIKPFVNQCEMHPMYPNEVGSCRMNSV